MYCPNGKQFAIRRTKFLSRLLILAVFVATIQNLLWFSNGVGNSDKRLSLTALTEYKDPNRQDTGNKSGSDVEKTGLQPNWTQRICSQRERKDHILKMCEKHDKFKFKARLKSHLIVDPKRKLFYCMVTKAGSTTWRGIMEYIGSGNKMYISDETKVHNYRAIQAAGLTFETEWKPEFEIYTKFVVIRHPYERSMSAFRQIQSGWMWAEIISPLVRHVQRLFPGVNDSPFGAEHLTINQFAKFVSSPHFSPKDIYRDRHIIEMVESCDICNVLYDHIIRLETQKHDAEPILKLLGLEPNFMDTMPKLNSVSDIENMNSNTTLPFSKSLPTMARIIPEYFARFEDRYYEDLEILGYHYDNKTQLGSCSLKSKNGDLCC